MTFSLRIPALFSYVMLVDKYMKLPIIISFHELIRIKLQILQIQINFLSYTKDSGQDNATLTQKDIFKLRGHKSKLRSINHMWRKAAKLSNNEKTFLHDKSTLVGDFEFNSLPFFSPLLLHHYITIFSLNSVTRREQKITQKRRLLQQHVQFMGASR